MGPFIVNPEYANCSDSVVAPKVTLQPPDQPAAVSLGAMVTSVLRLMASLRANNRLLAMSNDAVLTRWPRTKVLNDGATTAASTATTATTMTSVIVEVPVVTIVLVIVTMTVMVLSLQERSMTVMWMLMLHQTATVMWMKTIPQKE